MRRRRKLQGREEMNNKDNKDNPEIDDTPTMTPLELREAWDNIEAGQ